ncbi:DsbA family oxidoreductase [Terrisporobacter sp.]
MSLKIKVYSDYACPFCMLGKKSFEEAIKGKDVEVEWMPFELAPEGQEKLDPLNDPHKLFLWKESIRPLAKELNVNMEMPNLSPHPYTTLAFEAFHFAKEFGRGKEFNDRVFKALYNEGQDIGDINVLAKLAYEVGLDGELCLEALKTRKFKEVEKQYLNIAYEEGINSVPTFIIGDLRLEGVHSKQEFEDAINKELSKVS